MAVRTSDKVTTITPTAWKWLVGAVLILPIAPISFLLSPIFLLTATGLLQNTVLSPSGMTTRNWWSVKQYRWDEISNFRVSEVKYNFFTAASMVKFTHDARAETFMGKAAMALTGSTDSIPAMGIKPKRLMQLMQAYQQGEFPEDTHSVGTQFTQSTSPSRLAALKPIEIADITPKRHAKMAMPATLQPNTPRNNAPSKGSDRELFRRRSPLPSKKTPLPSPSTPLVQEGFKLFGRRPQN